MESWWEFERRGKFCWDLATCTFKLDIFLFFSANTGYSSTSASTLTTLSNNTSHLTVPQSSISPALSPTSTVVSYTKHGKYYCKLKKFKELCIRLDCCQLSFYKNLICFFQIHVQCIMKTLIIMAINLKLIFAFSWKHYRYWLNIHVIAIMWRKSEK